MTFLLDDERMQRQHACSENPLAATLAKRFPVLLWAAVCVLAVNLLAIVAVVTTEVSAGVGIWVAGNHWVVVVPTLLTAVIGVVLVLELRWMLKHQITPELVCKVPQGEPKRTSEMARLAGITEALQEPARYKRQHTGDLRARGYSFLSELQEQAALQRQPGAEERHSDAEVRRSWELLYATLADLVLAGLRGIEEKQEISPREARPGWRHLEETLSIVKRLTSIVHQRGREIHRKAPPRPCKDGRRPDNGRRDRRRE